MSYVGVNIGALTVNVVALRGDATTTKAMAHQGRPMEILEQLLATPEFADREFFGVSGHLGSAAIQRALREVQEVGDEFDAVASLGGESFLVYLLARMEGSPMFCRTINARPAAVSSSCSRSAGWDSSIDEAIRRSFAGKVVPLASRCSVHCKSDITHKLNRHEATPEDILHTLHDSMANKVVALLEKGQRELRRVLLIGGVTRNAAMLAALREKLPATEFVVLPESPWFEAWGSALLTRDKPLYKSPKISRPAGPRPAPAAPSLCRPGAGHRRAAPASRRPTARWCWEWMQDRRPPRRSCSIRRRAAWWPHITRARTAIPWPRCASASGRSSAQVGNRPVGLVGTTGSARELVGAYLGTEHVYNEISAHAAGATHFDAGRGHHFRDRRPGLPNTSTCAMACPLTTR